MEQLKIGKMVIGSVQTNCYFVYREGSREVICVDPADHGKQIYDKLQANGFTVTAIFLTHGHFDHILGVKELKEASGADIYVWEEEKDVCESAKLNVSNQIGKSYTIEADFYVKDGEVIEVCGMEAVVIGTPGHTKGSCCYYFEDDAILISGDTLFEESVGRSDLPTGSGATLGRSVKEKLFVLPDEVQVYPGHGDSTSIGHEKKYNPFCQ